MEQKCSTAQPVSAVWDDLKFCVINFCLVNPFSPTLSLIVAKMSLPSVQHHTGLTHLFYFFDIQAFWRSVLSTRVSKN